MNHLFIPYELKENSSITLIDTNSLQIAYLDNGDVVINKITEEEIKSLYKEIKKKEIDLKPFQMYIKIISNQASIERFGNEDRKRNYLNSVVRVRSYINDPDNHDPCFCLDLGGSSHYFYIEDLSFVTFLSHKPDKFEKLFCGDIVIAKRSDSCYAVTKGETFRVLDTNSQSIVTENYIYVENISSKEKTFLPLSILKKIKI